MSSNVYSISSLRIKHAEINLRARLAAYAYKPEFDGEITKALKIYWDGLYDIADIGLMEEADVVKTLEWYIYDYLHSRTGKTIVSMFYEDNTEALSAEEKSLLENWLRSKICVYEICRVNDDCTMLVKNLFTGRRYTVSDASTSQQSFKWDILVGRIVSGGEELSISGVSHIYPPYYRDFILKYLRGRYRLIKRSFPALSISGFLKKYSFVFNYFSIYNSGLCREAWDGEDNVLYDLVYEIKDEGTLASELSAVPELSAQKGESRTICAGQRKIPFVIYKTKVFIKGALKIEAETLKTMMARRFKKSLAFKVEVIRKQVRTSSPGILMPILFKKAPSSGYKKEIYDLYMKKRLECWLNTPIPQLKNKTPRQLAGTRGGKAKMLSLVKDIENIADRLKKTGGNGCDTGWLRKELDIKEDA